MHINERRICERRDEKFILTAGECVSKSLLLRSRRVVNAKLVTLFSCI
jgi:hypothetical protein